MAEIGRERNPYCHREGLIKAGEGLLCLLHGGPPFQLCITILKSKKLPCNVCHLRLFVCLSVFLPVYLCIYQCIYTPIYVYDMICTQVQGLGFLLGASFRSLIDYYMYVCRDKIGLNDGFTEIDPWQRRSKMGTPCRLDTERQRQRQRGRIGLDWR